MAGYLITGGSEEAAWRTVEKYCGETKEHLLLSGYGLILSRSGKKQYSVDDLEPLRAFLAEAHEHEKYCVIPDAGCLTEVVQNKLLKAIEDSPVVFFLLAPTASDILLTVQSRLIRIDLGHEGNKERQTVRELFSGLSMRSELFTRLQIDGEKGADACFQEMDVQTFFREVEYLFLSVIGYLEWQEGEDETVKSVSRLWKSDEAVRVCELCEIYTKLGNLTKDDFFIFVAKLCED